MPPSKIVFVQGNYDLTDALNVQAGIRYQRIESDTTAFKPTVAAIQGDITGQAVGTVGAGLALNMTKHCLI